MKSCGKSRSSYEKSMRSNGHAKTNHGNPKKIKLVAGAANAANSVCPVAKKQQQTTPVDNEEGMEENENGGKRNHTISHSGLAQPLAVVLYSLSQWFAKRLPRSSRDIHSAANWS